MLIIDRFEEPYAVCECENGEFLHIARRLLPATAREGDVLIQLDGRFLVDEAATQARRAQLRAKMRGLFS